ncbi:hypothetical protein HY004_03245 [Candidatus Saccharibacteria bacterium]|nr:hypothetical protein [Candidatus Saccharibacteria bacterium]
MMTNNKNVEIIKADPIDFITGLVINAKTNLPSLAGTTIKGFRDNSLKKDLIQAVKKISDQGKADLSNLSEDDKYDIYDDFNDIFDAIDDGINIKKYRILKNIFIASLTEEDKDKIYLRKLKSTFIDLTLDEILTLAVISTGDAEDEKTEGTTRYIMKLAEMTGLKQPDFVQSAIEQLVSKHILKRTYIAHGEWPLSALGDDLAKYIPDE